MQNIGQATVRYSSAVDKPAGLSQGVRLGAGGETDLIVQDVALTLGLGIFRRRAVGHGGLRGAL